LGRYLYNLFFAVFLLVSPEIVAQSREVDSLRGLLQKENADSLKASYEVYLSRAFRRINLHDSAVSAGNRALTITAHKEEPWALKQAALAEASIGQVYLQQQVYNMALDHYLLALQAFEKSGDRQKISTILGNIGLIYSGMSRYPKALDYYLKGLKIAEEIGDKGAIARCHGNIGIIYFNQKDFEKTLSYFSSALKIAEEIKSPELIATYITNIANTYGSMGDIPKAEEYTQRALKLAKELGARQLESSALINLANITDPECNKASSLVYFSQALVILREISDQLGIANTLQNMGIVYMRNRKYKEAYFHLTRARTISDSIGASFDAREDYLFLSELYEVSEISLPGEDEKKMLSNEEMQLLSNKYYKKHIALRDSLFNEENSRSLVAKELNYEFEKKELATKAEYERQRAIADAEEKRRTILLWLIVAMALSVAVIGMVVFRSLSLTKKQKIIIEEQALLTTKQKNIIEEKQKEIMDSIRYARRIQQSLLPTQKYMERILGKKA
jgi:tetratricopeptide (TPR) repeat protein